MANLFVKQEALGVEIKQNVKLPAFFCTVANLKNRFQLLIGLGSPYEEAFFNLFFSCQEPGLNTFLC